MSSNWNKLLVDGFSLGFKQKKLLTPLINFVVEYVSHFMSVRNIKWRGQVELCYFQKKPSNKSHFDVICAHAEAKKFGKTENGTRIKEKCNGGYVKTAPIGFLKNHYKKVKNGQ